MRAPFRRFVLGLLLSAGTVLSCQAQATTPDSVPSFSEHPASVAQLRELRHGGFVLYLRHGLTDNARPDRVPEVDLADCSTQRPLIEAGRKMAAQVGEAIRRARIPVGEMRISPLCRVKDTTAAAFPGSTPTLDTKLMYTANLTSAQKAPILANTRQWLSTPVAKGSNRLLVAHGPNLMDLMGYFPKEGTLVIFRPLGDGRFDYLGSVAPGAWNELLPHLTQ